MEYPHLAILAGVVVLVSATAYTLLGSSGRSNPIQSAFRPSEDASSLLLRAHRAIRDEAEVEAAKDAAADARTAEKAAAREAMARTVGPKGGSGPLPTSTAG